MFGFEDFSKIMYVYFCKCMHLCICLYLYINILNLFQWYENTFMESFPFSITKFTLGLFGLCPPFPPKLIWCQISYENVLVLYNQYIK